VSARPAVAPYLTVQIFKGVGIKPMLLFLGFSLFAFIRG